MTRSLFSTLAGAALLVAVSAAPEYKKPETTCTDTPVATYPAKHTGYPAGYPAKGYPASSAYPAEYPASSAYPAKGYPSKGGKSYPGHGEKPYPAASTSCTEEEASYPTGTYVKYPASTYAPSKEYPATYEGEYPVSSSTCTEEYPATYTGQPIPEGYTTKVVYSTSAYPVSTYGMNAYNASYPTTTTKYDVYPVATTLCPISEAYPTSTAYPMYTSTIYSTSCYDVTTYDNNKKPISYKTTEYVPVSTTVCPVSETYPTGTAAEASYPTGAYGAKPVGGSQPESYPAGGNSTGYPTGTGAYGAKPTYAVSAGAIASAAPALAAAAALSLFMGLMA